MPSSGGLYKRFSSKGYYLQILYFAILCQQISDVRSSFHLEETATEFDIQGLELDWTIVCWDADLKEKNMN